jgi:hypothetical protein
LSIKVAIVIEIKHTGKDTLYSKEQNQIIIGQYLWSLNFTELLGLLLYDVRYHIGSGKFFSLSVRQEIQMK